MVAPPKNVIGFPSRKSASEYVPQVSAGGDPNSHLHTHVYKIAKRETGQQNMRHTRAGRWFRLKKQGRSETCDNMDEPGR